MLLVRLLALRFTPFEVAAFPALLLCNILVITGEIQYFAIVRIFIAFVEGSDCRILRIHKLGNSCIIDSQPKGIIQIFICPEFLKKSIDPRLADITLPGDFPG